MKAAGLVELLVNKALAEASHVYMEVLARLCADDEVAELVRTKTCLLAGVRSLCSGNQALDGVVAQSNASSSDDDMKADLARHQARYARELLDTCGIST